MDTELALAAAEELSGYLEGCLRDLSTTTIPLTRNQALLTQGLLEGLADVLRRSAGGPEGGLKVS